MNRRRERISDGWAKKEVGKKREITKVPATMKYGAGYESRED